MNQPGNEIPSGAAPVPDLLARELQGLGQLAIDGVLTVTDAVEELHQRIASLAPPLGGGPIRRSRGITGLVYRSVRGVTRVVGGSLQLGLGALQWAPLPGNLVAERRADLRAVINGIWGDHLYARGNPLATPMAVCSEGQVLSIERAAVSALPGAGNGRVLLMLHGLCMHDRQWQRDGHEHGQWLARQLGATVLYLRYNSGLPITVNSHELASLLQALVQAWPVPVRRLWLVGHSMGGLLARAACREAERAGLDWTKRLAGLACIGSPHHGAPLERAGQTLVRGLNLSPYSRPFARLGAARSAGIRDLRHGLPRFDPGTTPESADATAGPPCDYLPASVPCVLVAGARHSPRWPEWVGDGLVPIASALGQCPKGTSSLPVPDSRKWIHEGAGHFDLLGLADVSRRIGRELAD